LRQRRTSVCKPCRYHALSCLRSQVLPQHITPFSVPDFLRRIVTSASNFQLTVSNGSPFIVLIYSCGVSLYT
jgi:hypothetical protein